jgi:sigma-E factor negative regulatory protein RseC
MLLGGLAGWLAGRGGKAARPVVLRREDNSRFHLLKG